MNRRGHFSIPWWLGLLLAIALFPWRFIYPCPTWIMVVWISLLIGVMCVLLWCFFAGVNLLFNALYEKLSRWFA